jgi:phage gp36-like protein
MFLEQQDLYTVIEQHVLDSIVEDDPACVSESIGTAIDTIKNYLSQRYDVGRILAAEGADRNRHILSIARTLTVWEIISRNNNDILYDKWEKRHEDAIRFLEKVGAGSLPADLPLATDDAGNIQSKMKCGSNPKFNHSF